MKRVFGLRLDTMSEAEIAAATEVLEFERQCGPVYHQPAFFPSKMVRRALQETLAEQYNTTLREIMTASRKRHYAYLRFASIGIVKELTGVGDSELVRLFGGGRNRTTFIYSRNQCEELMPYQDFKIYYDTIYEGIISRLAQWNIQQE